MANRSLMIASVVTAAMLPLTADAQMQRPVLTAASAQAIVEGCRTHAQAKHQSHGIAVYDAGGNPVAILRMDGSSPGVLAFAMEKAKAAAMWGFATSGMAEAVKSTPGFANAPGVVTVPGGLPIFTADGKAFLGGASASGEAPTDDVACVAAGITAAGLKGRMTRRLHHGKVLPS